MLMITPGAMKRLRGGLASYLAQYSALVTLPGLQEKRKKRKADQTYRRRLIDQAAAIMRRGEPSAFAFEGFMRHGLRAGLCLRGWSWADADDMAADIVRSALHQIGAKRPTYQQGQPEWTQDGIILIQRERCVRCGGSLSEFQRKFCSRLCHSAHHADLHRRFAAEQLEAVYDDAP